MSASRRIQEILASLGLEPLTQTQAESFNAYLALLVKWNARLNLTAIRDEEAILRRHFVESIECARLLPSGITTLLDFGSGGGFPGLPIAISRPEIAVTLADSQAKKAAFLREAVRTLRLPVVVHSGRVEAMPASQQFDAVTLRAVNRMEAACRAALPRLRGGGWLAILTTGNNASELQASLDGVQWSSREPLVGMSQGALLLGQRVPPLDVAKTS